MAKRLNLGGGEEPRRREGARERRRGGPRREVLRPTHHGGTEELHQAPGPGVRRGASTPGTTGAASYEITRLKAMVDDAKRAS